MQASSAGDKLAVATWEKEGTSCRVALTTAEDLASMVKATLGPVMEEIPMRKHNSLPESV